MIRISVLYPNETGKKFDAYFNSLADFQQAMEAHGKEIMGDIPNYTNIQPQVQISEIVS